MTMYLKCSRFEDAEMTFENLLEPNLVSFTLMMQVFMQTGRCSQVLELFHQMQWKGFFPDGFTYASALDACASLFAFSEGIDIHSQLLFRGIDIDLILSTSLVNMYSECGSFRDAEDAFDRKSNKRNNISFNAMISACAHHGQGIKAICYFKEMQEKGFVPDACTFLSILSSCSHAGLTDHGILVFSLMLHDHHIVPGAEHYDCLVDLVGRAGQLNEAEHLLINVHKDPSAVSYRTLLGACRHQADVERAKHIANKAFELKPGDDGAHLMCANIFCTNVDG
jgi:pentatricopeptide repeat protein